MEEGTASHSSILAWRIPWTKDPGGLQSLGLQRVRHKWVTKHTSNSHYWSNRLEYSNCLEYSNWPWSTEWSRAKVNRVLPKNALVIANTVFKQHKRRLYTWTSPDGRHRNQIDYILCSQRWRSSIQSAKTRLGVDCGSDHELLIAKFRLKLKKIGKSTRPFRYDLKQIPYDYTVEVTNRFKGLDLIECLMNYEQRSETL